MAKWNETQEEKTKLQNKMEQPTNCKEKLNSKIWEWIQEKRTPNSGKTETNNFNIKWNSLNVNWCNGTHFSFFYSAIFLEVMIVNGIPF